MERPQPTTQLILELTGGNQGLVSAAHHGLYETPLDRLYTNLNLDEVIVFAATSWGLRSKDLESFAAVVRFGDVYKIFDYVNQIGFRRLNKNKPVPQELRGLYEQLNPYKGRNLRQRLERVDPAAVGTLRERLQHDTNHYITEGQLNSPRTERAEGGNRKVTMQFLPTHPKKGQTAQHYAAEVARMLSGYPQGYEPLDGSRPQPPREQLVLF